ncbi:MAG: leucine-rich repeat protein, partial [Muribaculaceae bacterium]|nr:leucine-rich repeat protein [Muribaculaceae bacterium]
MKRILLLLLIAMASALSYADTNYTNVTIGDFKYDLTLRTSGENTAVLNGLDDSSFSGYMRIPGYVDYNGNKYRVDRILNYAFRGNKKITRVYIDYGMKSIQVGAFENCTAIAQVILPSSISTIAWDVFQNCSSLTKVAYAGDVPPKIYASTFAGTPESKWCYTATPKGANALKNNSLWSIAFGDNIERDNFYAYDFKDDGVAYVIKNGIPYSNDSRCIMVGGNSTNDGIVTLSQHVTAATMQNSPGNYFLEAVADSAFLGNTSVTKVANNMSMAYRIGEAAFANCTNLTSAYISVDSIMINAFKNCTNLTTVKMYKHNQDGPNGVRYIGNYAFENTKITTVNIPGSVKAIGNAPFIECSNLKTITVDSDNEYFASYNGCLYNYNLIRLYQVPGAWDCSSYGNYNTGFANTLKYINDYAFEGNRTIVNLTLPYGVEQINYRALGYCPNLQGVRLPSSITNLSPYFLRGSTNVQYLYVNLTTPPSLSTYIFASSIANNIKLYVPCESYSAYKSATYWKTFDLQTGTLDHTEVWDYWDYYNRRWTVLDNTVHNNYAGNIRAGNVRLVRSTASTTIPASVVIGTKYYDPVEIGRSAFEGLPATGTISVTSGESIERIKERAFYGTALSDFTFTRVKEIGDS